MPLFVHRSNRTEALVDALSEVLREPLGSVFAPEHIVVQGAGMERWLTGQLATRFGVWAAPSFPYPRAAAELVLDAFLGPAPAESKRFTVDNLILRIAAALPSLLDQSGFETLRAYLAADSHGGRLLSVSTELARSFDRYAVYRPEFLRGFEQRTGDQLQGALWRAIADGAYDAHFAARLGECARRAGRFEPVQALPERLCLFGLSALAPALAHVFRVAAQRVPVHVFLLVPVRDYYDDFDRSTRHRRDAGGLVGRFGRMIRELDHDLAALEGVDVQVLDHCTEEHAPHALGRLQAALLSLEEASPTRTRVPAGDDSVRVNVCTSKVRELQVLRDELITRFEASDSLGPRDVVVLVPNIADYTQAIDSVFGDEALDPAIPYRIGDVATARSSEVATALLQFVGAVHGRFTLSELLDLVHTEKLRACFALEDTDLAHFESWLESAGGRFGFAGDESGLGTLHSLSFALDRLLLGSVLPDLALGAFGGVVPHPTVEGKASESLGKLARIVRSVQGFTRELAQPASIARHALTLVRVIDALFDGARGDDPVAATLKQSLTRIAADSTELGASQPVDVRSVAALLSEQLDGSATTSAFLTGSVTFCQHVPMRAIPFRVVCMIGMDEGAFPRRARPNPFDLSTRAQRRGDRNPRDDDRQLFLDALLSARDALVISYVSEAEGSHDPRGPSSTITHLLRALDAHVVFGDPEAQADAAPVLRKHARLAFDPRYFERDAPYRSFDQRALALARTWLGPKAAAPAFAPTPLTARPAEATLQLAELVRFFKHPQRTFFQHRLGVRMWDEREASADREPVVVQGLERFAVGERVLHELAELPREVRAQLLGQTGELPKGMLGHVQLAQLEHTASALHAAVELGAAQQARELHVALEQGALTLTGQLAGMRAGGRRQVVFGTLTVKRRLSAWIEHLALCLQDPEGALSVLVGRDKTAATVVRFAAVEDPARELTSLIALYRVGLREPLPFFADASHAFARARIAGKADEDAYASAARAVFGGAYQQSEAASRDPYLLRAFAELNATALAGLTVDVDGRTVSFAELSERVFRPLLAAEQTGAEP